jgi:hypothetical protein
MEQVLYIGRFKLSAVEVVGDTPGGIRTSGSSHSYPMWKIQDPPKKL